MRVLLALTAVVLGAILLAWYLTDTSTGAQWTVAFASKITGGAFSVGSTRGTLAAGLELRDMTYTSADRAISVRLKYASLQINLRGLLRGEVDVRRLDAQGLDIAVLPSPIKSPGPPLHIQLPIAIDVERLDLQSAVFNYAGSTTIDLASLSVGVSWRGDRLQLRAIAVHSQRASMNGDAVIVLRAPFIESAEGDFSLSLEKSIAGRFSIKMQNDAFAIGLGLSAPVVAQVGGSITLSDSPVWNMTLDVPAFDPRQLSAAFSIQRASASFRAQGDLKSARCIGTVDLDESRVAIEHADLAWTSEIIKIQSSARVDGKRGDIALEGEIRYTREPIEVRASVNWQDVALPFAIANRSIESTGEFELEGSASHVKTRGNIAAKVEGRQTTIEWLANGSLQVIDIERLHIAQGSGQLEAHGLLDRGEQKRWKFDARAQGFDPSIYFANYPGSIDLVLATEGTFDQEGPRGTATLRSLGGTLRGSRLSGHGSLRLERRDRLEGRLDIRSGQSALAVVGRGGSEIDATATVDIPALAQIVPSAAGSLNLRAHARGHWPRLAIKGELNAHNACRATACISRAMIDLSLDDVTRPKGKIAVQMRGIDLGVYRADSVDALLSGQENDHAFELRAKGEQLDLQIHANGRFQRRRWAGTLTELGISATQVPSLELDSPVGIELSATRGEIGLACLSGADIRLCGKGRYQADGTAEAHYDVRSFPLALVMRLTALDSKLKLDGRLEGQGDVKRLANAEMHGNASLSMTRTSIEFVDAHADPLVVSDASIRLAFAGKTAKAQANAKIAEAGSVSAWATIAGVTADAHLNGKATMRFDDLAPIAGLMPQLSALKGSAILDATLTGALREPHVALAMNVSKLECEIPRFGLKLRDGSASLQTQANGELTLSARVQSGDGSLAATGEGNTLATLKVKLAGSNVTAIDVPGASVVIDPNLELFIEKQALTMTGTLKIPRAAIDFNALTLQNARSASSDVIVVDRERPHAAREVPINADIQIILGENVHLKGVGLDGGVQGRIRVRETPDAEPSGSGEINVGGTYEVYGRKLSIERARLIFAGTDLDDPQLDILASRKLPDAKISVRIAGTARQPKLTVFADEDLTQTEALSYLLTGKPPSELREEEGAMLKSAKDSLGSMVGDRLARRVAGKFGIESIGVEQNAELGGSALTIGKYLSPRFFVSYGVSLFESGSVVSLRYKINDRWSFKAMQSPEDQHAGVEYRIER